MKSHLEYHFLDRAEESAPDIGFDRDRINNGLTQKIGPATDGEREYVNETLSGTGLVAARSHITPALPLTEAKTATGGEFHSDGRILVLVLREKPTRKQMPLVTPLPKQSYLRQRL